MLINHAYLKSSCETASQVIMDVNGAWYKYYLTSTKPHFKKNKIREKIFFPVTIPCGAL